MTIALIAMDIMFLWPRFKPNGKKRISEKKKHLNDLASNDRYWGGRRNIKGSKDVNGVAIAQGEV